jgi:hypothetical protein
MSERTKILHYVNVRSEIIGNRLFADLCASRKKGRKFNMKSL